jgi:hypothetical protein
MMRLGQGTDSMQTIELQSRADDAGLLHLNVDAGQPNVDYDVLVILRPKSAAPNGWLPDFFERTAGAWQGEPLVRETL